MLTTGSSWFLGGRKSNYAIVVVSSELPEVLALSNRLYAMHQGRIAAELVGEARTEQNVLASFFEDRLEEAA